MSKIKWTEEKIREEALKYSSRWELQTLGNKCYQAALYRGILDSACSHMPALLNNWSYESLQTEALKYRTRTDFKNGNYAAYTAAYNRNLLGTLCSHMDDLYVDWSEELIRQEALKYNTRGEFSKNSESAYKAATRRKILNSVCQHMYHGKKGINLELPAALYVVSLIGSVKQYIGFGISNHTEVRLSKHTTKANRLGFSLSTITIHRFASGKDAASLEKILKQNLPIVNTGIEGFKTEAILAKDYDKLIKIVDDYLTDQYNSQ